MDKHILVVCDLEEEYAKNLTDYLCIKKNVPFEIHAFSQIDKFLIFAENQKIDILLVSEEAMYDMGSHLDSLVIGETFILDENGEMTLSGRYKSVYKYQSTENILREVMSYYAESGTLIQSRIHQIEDMEMIAVYSPVKRSLKTSFAMTLGQILAEEKRVLYINLEEYSGFNKLFNTNYMTDMSDLMYYISQEKPNFIWKLASLVQSIGGMDYIPPALSQLDIKSITGEQWINFLHELRKCNYEVIILDMGETVRGLYDILRMCSQIYTPVRDDAVSYAKMEQYEALLKIMEYEDILEKTRKLSFTYFKGLEKGFDRLVYSELGQYVRKIIRKEQLI